MEALWLAAGLVIGSVLTHLAISLTERRGRERSQTEERRLLYARTLATYDSAYRLIDFFISWPRRTSRGGSTTSSERPTGKTGAILSDASSELDAVTRRSRELAAELRLAGGTEVVPFAVALHDALEEAVLALRVDTPAKLERRWSVVGPNWRSAREAFAQAARDEVAGP